MLSWRIFETALRLLRGDCSVIASEAKQSRVATKDWIASSLRSSQ
jgi:hypothetical protein